VTKSDHVWSGVTKGIPDFGATNSGDEPLLADRKPSTVGDNKAAENLR
jgi:hypothetical protein